MKVAKSCLHSAKQEILLPISQQQQQVERKVIV